MPKSVDELFEGGRGIKIMSQVADELSYRRTLKQQNCLLIVKNYEHQGLEQPQDMQKGSVLGWLIEFFYSLNWLKSKRYRKKHSNTPLQKNFLKVNTKLKDIEQVLNWYKQLENLPIPRSIFLQCQIALVEGFTNAVRYAHKDLPWATPIELEVTVFKERIEMRIWDDGQPFDFDKKLSELRKTEQKFFDTRTIEDFYTTAS